MTSSPTENSAAEREQTGRSKTDFSIDHILNRAGNSSGERKASPPFPWLHCTRYCPPKIPRNQRKEGPQKRQLGRHPRIPFTSQQLAVLEEKFRQTPYLSSAEVTRISRRLQLADVRVKIWFQNRRARERREKSQLENDQRLSPNSANATSTSEYMIGTPPSPTPYTSGLEHNLLESGPSRVISLPVIFPSILPTYSTVLQDAAEASSFLNFSRSPGSDD